MISLKITTTNGAVSNHDSNFPGRNLYYIVKAELKERGVGVGRRFKGRAPNAVTLFTAPDVYKNIVLADNFDLKSISEMMLVDTSNPNRKPVPFHMGVDLEGRACWFPEIPEEEIDGGLASTDDPVYEIQQLLKSKFEGIIGSVGVNNLDNVAFEVEVQLPTESNNSATREKIQNFCWSLRKKFGVQAIRTNFLPVGQSKVEHEYTPIGQGLAGEASHPDQIKAGRAQIEPREFSNMGVSSGLNLREANGDDLQPGDNAEPYGADPVEQTPHST